MWPPFTDRSRIGALDESFQVRVFRELREGAAVCALVASLVVEGWRGRCGVMLDQRPASSVSTVWEQVSARDIIADTCERDIVLVTCPRNSVPHSNDDHFIGYGEIDTPSTSE